MDSISDANAAVNLSTYQLHNQRGTPSHSPHQEPASPASSASVNDDNDPHKNGDPEHFKESLAHLEEKKYSVDNSTDGETSNGEVISGSSRCGSESPAPNRWGIASPAHKDPAKAAADPAAGASVATNPMLLMPQALQHQVQQLLRDQFIYPQTMLLYQKQQQEKLADFGRKQLETVMQQLQEQLHLNLIQQTQLMDLSRGTVNGISQEERKKSSELVQTLAGQQQQLIQQLQLTHRHYLLSLQQQELMANPLNANEKQPNGLKSMKQDEDETPLKSANVAKSNGSSAPTSPTQVERLPAIECDESSKKHCNQEGLAVETKLYDANTQQQQQPVGSENVKTNEAKHCSAPSSSSSTPSQPWTHPLFLFGVCRWPGCESPCEDSTAFMDHLNKEHVLDDRSTAQTRVQMQVVAQLELQLQKERDRLQSMMDHLNRARSIRRETPECSSSPILRDSIAAFSGSDGVLLSQNHLSLPVTSGSLFVRNSNQQETPLHRGPLNATLEASPALQRPAFPSPTPGHLMSKQSRYSEKANLAAPSDDSRLRKRGISERPSMHISEGFPYLLDRTGLDVHQELQRNREFYRNADVRPPFTYASLIRQAIIESPERQLTLNEIYTWFQNTFCYFRHNAATWKNAIRTNLSLHKCFVRYEDDFGSFWMVDDVEFLRRRHLARGRPRKFDMPPAPPVPNNVDSKIDIEDLQASAAGKGSPRTQLLINDHTKNEASGLHSKSPNMASSPTLIADTGNKNPPIALAESNINYFRNTRQTGAFPSLGYPFNLALDPHKPDSQDPKFSLSKRIKLEGTEERIRQAAAMAEDFFGRANYNPYDARHRAFKEETYHSDDLDDEASSNVEEQSINLKKDRLSARMGSMDAHFKIDNGLSYSSFSGRTLQGGDQTPSIPSVASPKNGYRIESTITPNCDE